MQNDPLSHGLWEMTAPPAPPTSPLNGEVRADVAIIGCGYTGLSTALQLRGGRSEGCRFGGGRDRFRRRGAQRRPGQRRHVACARRCRDEARARLWRAAARIARRWTLRGRGARHQAWARLRIRAQRHAALRDRAVGPRQDRGALRAMGRARRAGEASQPRGDGAADRRRHLCGLVARPARRHHPAARLCARACARGARRGRKRPHAEPGAFGGADGQGLAPQDRRRKR